MVFRVEVANLSYGGRIYERGAELEIAKRDALTDRLVKRGYLEQRVGAASEPTGEEVSLPPLKLK